MPAWPWSRRYGPTPCVQPPEKKNESIAWEKRQFERFRHPPNLTNGAITSTSFIDFPHIFRYGFHNGLNDSSKHSHKIGQDSYSENFKTSGRSLTLPFLQKYHVACQKCTQTLCKKMVKDTVEVANSYAILTMLMRKRSTHRNKYDSRTQKKHPRKCFVLGHPCEQLCWLSLSGSQPIHSTTVQIAWRWLNLILQWH